MKYYKSLIFAFIIYILASFATYFSMHVYSTDISSSCFECSYKKDVFLSSIHISVIFLLLILLKNILKKKWSISIFFTIIFAILVFFNNYNIFVDRVSSWSSYTFTEELLSVLSNSYLYLGISTILVFVLLKLFKF